MVMSVRGHTAQTVGAYLYVNRFLVIENSPSLCPTISCVTITGVYVFPLCTRKRMLQGVKQNDVNCDNHTFREISHTRQN